MIRALFSIIIALLIAVAKFGGACNEYKLVFSDDFNGDKLDLAKWNIEEGPRNDAFNTPRAISIEEGNLVIRSFEENGKLFTGIINSRDKFSFNKGIVETRAKFNDVAGTWSNIWLYSDSAGLDQPFDGKNGIEVDLFEHRKYDCNRKDISNFVNHTIHWGGYKTYHKCLAGDTGDRGLGSGFHIYSLVWDEKYYSFLVDGRVTMRVSEPHTSAKLFLVLSSELGYLDFWTQKPEKNINSKTLIVDYIKVYQK